MKMSISNQRLKSFQREDLTFDVIDSGPLDGQPFILLHGFPETNKSWLEASTILNENGYRTFAVNQRGYSLNARPKGRKAYRSAALVEDIHELLDIIAQPVYLVGHDWGAVVAWEVAIKYPEQIRHLITISVPHKAAFIQSMLTSNQLFKSYYMGLFQLPKIPEILFEKLPKIGEGLLRKSGMTDAQLEDFRQDMIKEKRISTAINWYRALPYGSQKSFTEKVKVPTLFIWGKHDSAIGQKSVELNKNFVDAPYTEVIMDATHWIPVQNAQELCSSILKTIG
nr:alpha/beta hydrolase [Acinetobacter stercoris]